MAWVEKFKCFKFPKFTLYLLIHRHNIAMVEPGNISNFYLIAFVNMHLIP